jgi:hypothetical protein
VRPAWIEIHCVLHEVVKTVEIKTQLSYCTPRQLLGNVVISGAVSPDDFTQPLVDSPFTRQILNSPSTTWECEISFAPRRQSITQLLFGGAVSSALKSA